MKKSAWKRIAQIFRISLRSELNARQTVELCTSAAPDVANSARITAAHGDDEMSGTVEFRFSFDANDTMLLPIEGKRTQCPCCDDEFTAFPDGAVACSRCLGTMQGKHLRDRQLYPLGGK